MYIFMHSMYCIYLGVHLGKNTSGWIVQCCLCILSEPCAATMFDQPTLPPPHHGSVKSGRKSSQIARCLSRSFHFFHWPMIVFERSGGHPRTHSGVTSTHRHNFASVFPPRVTRAHRLESRAHTAIFQSHPRTQTGVTSTHRHNFASVFPPRVTRAHRLESRARTAIFQSHPRTQTGVTSTSGGELISGYEWLIDSRKKNKKWKSKSFFPKVTKKPSNIHLQILCEHNSTWFCDQSWQTKSNKYPILHLFNFVHTMFVPCSYNSSYNGRFSSYNVRTIER